MKNLNFGVVGKAKGFPSFVLKRGAGWAQGKAETSKNEWNSWFSAYPYGDDPRDQEQINLGIQFYEKQKKNNLFFIFIFILFSCNLCENYIIKEVPNIHSGVSAVQFKRNCGATTGNNIQVSIVKTNKGLNNKKGNVFIIKGSILDMYWKNTNSLVIKYRCKDEDVFFKRDSLSKYNIIYENTN